MEELKCPECGSTDYRLDGTNKGTQYYKCKNKICGRRFNKNSKPSRTDFVKPIDMQEKSTLGISINDFMLKNDPKTIIKNGLKKLSGDYLYKNEEFKKLIGLPPNFSINRLLDYEELEGYHGKCNGIIYWSKKETIEKLKFEALLS